MQIDRALPLLPLGALRLRMLALALVCLSVRAWGEAELPSAPEPQTAAEPPAIRLPRSYQQPWAVQRPHLLGKLAYGFGSTLSFRTFLEADLLGGIPNLTTAPTQPDASAYPLTPTGIQDYTGALNAYGDAVDAWAKKNEVILRDRGHRYEVGLATGESRDLLSNLLLPIVLHQNARYVPANIDLPFGQRMDHALTSIVVTRGDNGRLQPNYSKLVGTVGAAFLGEEAFAPLFKANELGRPRFVAKYIGYSLAGDLATNVAHELVRTAVRPDLQMYNLHGRARDDSYYPLSVGGKFIFWMQSTYQVRNLIQGVLTAGLPIIPKEPIEPALPPITPQNQLMVFMTIYQYGNDVAGWRRYIENNIRYHEHRLIGGVAESETQLFLERFAIPVTCKMDPRYIPLGSGYSAGDRAGYALKSLFVGHTDAGNRFLNLPELGGTIGAAFLAKESYYPTLGTPALSTTTVLARTITLNIAADAILNEISEFLRHRTY